MAIHFETATPKKLLATYKKAIDDHRVTTWSYDADGDFTHTAEQWNNRAWLRPKVVPQKELVLHILTPSDTHLDSVVYAVYHGRFIELMLRHCDNLFRVSYATSMPEGGDVT